MNKLAFTLASELNDGELVSRPFRVTCWPVVGRPLEVPVGHQAVLTGPQGVINVLGEGLQNLQGLPWGPYMVQLVDVRRRHLELPSVPALTQDSWQANVQASLEYRVRSPHAVVQLDKPLKTLREAAVSAITYVIKTTPHDLLIGTADCSGSSHEAIAARIQRQLQAPLRGSGLEVINVFVTHLQEDERRLGIKHQLEQARIKAKVTQLAQWGREQETRLQLLPDLSRQQHERILEAIKALGQILDKVADLSNLEVLGVSSRRRPEEPGLNRLEAVLMQILANLQALLAQEPMELASGGDATLQDSDVPLLVRLANEINELSTIEGLTWTHINPVEDGGLCLEARLNGIALDITCRPGFPDVRPEVVVSGNGHDRAPFPLPWSEPRSLKEVVLEAARHFSGAASTHDGTSSAPVA
jgi:hypothetical protein